MSGDLTPECAEAVAAVLDALSAPAGADDDRSQEQRYHDALQEAMTRLIAAGILPERAGQPVKVWAHISLADLLRLDGSSALQEEWTAQVRARWDGYRAAASEGGGDAGAWLDGDAAEAIACDAAMAPIVTGDVNVDALDDLVRLCVELDARRRDGTRDAAWAAIEQAVIGKAVDLLSGPGGLASFLRRRQLGARLSGPSLPLDIGYAETVPAGIRNAVTLRDKHCQWAGRCDQPAEACQVHHTRHKADGGPTSVKDCVLLCWFHHQVVIHRWGWTLVLNPDGTTTAWNKDKTKVLHSHGPPVRPG
jgi:transposase InsO family protein